MTNIENGMFTMTTYLVKGLLQKHERISTIMQSFLKTNIGHIKGNFFGKSCYNPKKTLLVFK